MSSISTINIEKKTANNGCFLLQSYPKTWIFASKLNLNDYLSVTCITIFTKAVIMLFVSYCFASGSELVVL